MAETDPRWRTALWRYLGERIGEEVRVGELVELFADSIPLHHATRIWLSGCRGNRLDGPLRMRRHCLTFSLRQYDLVWRPARGRRRPIADSDIVIPQARACIRCGTPFFATRQTVNCGRSCGQKSVFHDRGENGRYTARMVPV